MGAASIRAQIRRWVEEYYKDEDFAAWFGSTGRPSKPPSVVALCSNFAKARPTARDAVDNARFNDRWEFALAEEFPSYLIEK